MGKLRNLLMGEDKYFERIQMKLYENSPIDTEKAIVLKDFFKRYANLVSELLEAEKETSYDEDYALMTSYCDLPTDYETEIKGIAHRLSKPLDLDAYQIDQMSGKSLCDHYEDYRNKLDISNKRFRSNASGLPY